MSKDLISEIKKRDNKLIADIKTEDKCSKVHSIIGDYSPGCIYGNVKYTFI